MKARILDCLRFFDIVKLRTVVRDQGIIILATCIHEQEPAFLAFPAYLLDVIDRVPSEQVSYGLDKL